MLKKWRKFPKLTSKKKKVVLLGDSVLDNFFWLDNPRRSLRLVLEERLQSEDIHCLNFAVDQMSTFDFLDRGKENGWKQYQSYREAVHPAADDPLDRDGYKHLQGPDGRIRSAANVSYLENVQYEVISCGGNDIYLNAGIQTALITSLLPFCDKRSKVAAAMAERMDTCLSELSRVSPSKRILMICYHPHHGFSISGMTGCVGGLACSVQRTQLSWMVTPAIQGLLTLAMQKGYDVIDLSQTFDPTNVRHYGNMNQEDPNWSGAEPSDVSQEFMATLISHAMKERTASPSAPAKCYHGITNGDSYLTTEETVITDTSIKSYRFQKGFARVEREKEGKKKKEKKTSKVLC